MKKGFLLFGFMAFALASCYSVHQVWIAPQTWQKPSYDFAKNPLTPEKILLGRALFHETQLSRNNTVSCASCHLQYSAFTHIDHDLSHGIEDRIGTRNSPTIMNVAWQSTFMWDGAIHHLDVQALAPISHPDEMDNNIQNVVATLRESAVYRKLFHAAYQDSLATGERTLKAISAFLLTLVSANAKYDQVMRKETTFTAQEANGYRLFKQYCNECHREPLFTTHEFANNGLKIDPTLNDFGRMKITHTPNDSLKFKIPTLRNIEFSFPYMHDGRFRKLSEVFNHYTTGIQQSATLSPVLQRPISLSSNEKVDLLAFLLTLTDKEFIFNAKFSYPREVFDTTQNL